MTTPHRKPTVDFSISVNPLGPPLSVLEVLRRELPGVARYPDSECADLTRRLACHHGVAPEQVIVANGSSELIFAIARAYRPRAVAIAEPTFTEYLRASWLVGAVVDHWLAEGSRYDPAPFDPGRAEVVWLCNPNNPTGRLWPPDSLSDWIRNRPKALFVVDEAFLPFLKEDRVHSLIADLDRLLNVVVLRSLTKLYGLPGLRLGYAVTSPPIRDTIRGQLAPWSVNSLAQVAGIAALDDSHFLRQTWAWFDAERRSFDQTLDSLSHGTVIVPSRANFNLLQLRQGSSAWLTRRLAERGIAVRDASNFVGLSEGHLRVAMRTALDNQRLLGELLSILGEDSV